MLWGKERVFKVFQWGNIGFNGAMEHLNLLESDELIALAKIDFDNNRLTDALIKLKHVENLSNPPIEAAAYHAKVLARLGLHGKAIKHYTHFLSKNPDATVEQFELGISMRECGDITAAMNEWDRVLASEPDFPPALFYKGLALLDQSETDEATQILRRLVDLQLENNLYVKNAKEILQSIASAVDVRSSSATSENEASLKH